MTTIQSPGALCQLWKKCNQKHPFSNASRDNYFQFRARQTCLGLVILEIKLVWGWVGKILKRDKLKNRTETGKNAQFSRALKLNFPNLSLNGKNIFRFTILTQNTPLQFKNGAKKLKTNSEKIFNHSLKFEPLPSFISELNPTC